MATPESLSMAVTSSGVSLTCPGSVGHDPFRPHRFRDDDEAVRHMPGDDHLRGSRLVLARDRHQSRIIEIASLERAVPLQHYAALLQPGRNSPVVERRTPADLIDRRNYPGRRRQFIDLVE